MTDIGVCSKPPVGILCVPLQEAGSAALLKCTAPNKVSQVAVRVGIRKKGEVSGRGMVGKTMKVVLVTTTFSFPFPPFSLTPLIPAPA